MELSVYQDSITEVFNVLPRKISEFETLHVDKRIPQSIVLIGEKYSYCGNKDLMSSCCQQPQYG